MKKLLLLSAALVAAASCSEVSTEDQTPSIPTSTPAEVSVTVSANNATKVSIQDDWTVTWDETDEIMLYSTTSNGNIFVFDITDYQATESTFSGTIDVTANGAEETKNVFRFLYPVDLSQTYTSSSLTKSKSVTFDISEQEAGLNNTCLVSTYRLTYAEGALTSASEGDFGMDNIGSAIDLNVRFSNAIAGYTLSSITVSGASSGASVDLSNTAYSVTTTTGDIAVEFDDVTSFDSDINIKFNTFAVDNTDVTILFNLLDASGGDVSISSTFDGVTIERGKYVTINAICDFDNIEVAPYAIGDIYTDPDTGAKGIVSYVGVGFAMALSYDVNQCYWITPTSDYSGLGTAFASMKLTAVGQAGDCLADLTESAFSTFFTNGEVYPGESFAWAASLGEDWYIPTSGDWLAIFPQFISDDDADGTYAITGSDVDAIMIADGGTAFGRGVSDPRYFTPYCSSTKIYVAKPIANGATTQSDYNSSTPYARAVKYLYWE